MPDYESFSSLDTWLTCGLKYYLKYRARIREAPAWWSVGGTAVHAATERYDRQLFERTGQ